MNNFKEVLVALEMVKKKEKNEKKSKRWAAFLGAVVVVLLATALTSTRTASKLNLSLFFKNPNSCHCPQVLINPLMLIRLRYYNSSFVMHVVEFVLFVCLFIRLDCFRLNFVPPLVLVYKFIIILTFFFFLVYLFIFMSVGFKRVHRHCGGLLL